MKNAKIVLLCKREAKQASSIACCPKLLFPIRCQVVPHLFSKKAMNHYNLACHLSLKICKVSPTLKHIIGFASLFLVKLKLSTVKYRKTVAFSRFFLTKEFSQLFLSNFHEFFNQRIFTIFLVKLELTTDKYCKIVTFSRIFSPKEFYISMQQIINKIYLCMYVAGFKPFLLCTS